MADVSSLDGAALRRYLLGRASAQESSEVEEVYFADPDLFERVEEQDEALLHEYLRGDLTPAEQRDFEHTLASMPRRRERLTLVRQLQQRAAAQRASGARRAMQVLLAMVATDRSPSRRAMVGVATACAILAVTTAWLGREVVRLGTDVRQATLAREAAERESAAAREALATERTRNGVAMTPGSTTPATSAGANAGVLAVTLAPGLLRDGPLASVAITSDTLLVRFRLILPVANHSQYQVTLQTAAGEERWRQTGLAPVRDASSSQLRVDIPSAVLDSGQLTLVVRPVGAGSTADDGYHFAVLR